MDNHRRRYFIVTFGRSGSSLLCHILQSCGAAFDMPSSASPNTFASHLEHRRIARAVKAANTANRFYRDGPLGIGKAGFDLWRSVAKRMLRRALPFAVYSKARRNTAVVPLAAVLGYQPKLIVMYRSFADIIVSDIEKSKNVPSYYLTELEQTYSDAHYLLHRYGGVVIDFDELMDGTQRQWARPLADLTKLDYTHLVRQRDRLLRHNHTRLPRDRVHLPPSLQALERAFTNGVVQYPGVDIRARPPVDAGGVTAIKGESRPRGDSVPAAADQLSPRRNMG